MGFVTRNVNFPTIIDLQPLFKTLSLPFYDDFLPINRYVLLTLASVFTIGILTLILLLSFTTPSHRASLTLTRTLKIICEAFLGLLFLPMLSLLMSFLPCSVPVDSELSFSPRVPISSCSDFSGIVLRAFVLTIALILIILNYMWISTNDDNPFSKRLFSCSHPRAHQQLLFSQILFLTLFFLFHHRYWEFRIIYIACSLYLSFFFYRTLPFYRQHVNIKVMVGFGCWTGTSIAFFIYSIVAQYTTPHVAFNASVFYGSMFTKKITSVVRQIQESLVEAGAVLESGKLDPTSETSQLEGIVPDFTSFFVFDCYTRALGTKLLATPYLAAVHGLMVNGETRFMNNILFLICKLRFEVLVLKDHIQASVTMNNIRDLDIDLKYDERYLIIKYSQQLETLRRAHSTGMSIDSAAFIHVQRQQKELGNLHKKTLEGLYQFWNILAAQNVDLSVLPKILEQIQNSKNGLDNLLHKMLQQQGDQKYLLEAYANFAKDIECDDDKAMAITDQIQLLSSSDRSSGMASSVGSRSISGAPSKPLKKKQRTIGLFAGHGDEAQQKSAIYYLKFAVHVALLVMLALSALSYYISSSFLTQTDVRFADLFDGTHTHIVGQLLGSYAMESLLPYQTMDSRKNLGFKILLQAEHLSFHLQRLTLYDTPSSNASVCPTVPSFFPPTQQMFTHLTLPRFASFTVHDFVPLQESAEIESFWTLGLRHSHFSSVLARRIMAENLVVPIALVNTFSSSLYTVYSSVNRFYDYLISLSEASLLMSIFFQIISAATIFLIIIVMAFALFARSLNKISEERQVILNLFLHIPKTEVFTILKDPKFDFLRKRSKRLDLSTPKEQKQDSEEAKPQKVPHSEGVKLKSNIILIFSIITCIGLLSFSLFFVLFIDQRVDEIYGQFDLAMSARATAADVTITHRLLSTYLQYFSGFGDLFFLDKFQELYYSGVREEMIRKTLDMELSDAELSEISQGNTHLNEIKYLERIALSLLPVVYPFPQDMFSFLSNFTYNIDDETVAFKRALEFPGVTHWYSNLTHDMSLNHDEILTLARHAICSPRWLQINSRFMAAMEGVPAQIVESRNEQIKEMVEDVNVSLFAVVLSIGTCAVIFLISFAVFIFNRKAIKFGHFFFVFAGLFVLGVLASAIALLFFKQETFYNVQNIALEGVDFFSHLIQTEFLFHGIKRTPQVMAYEEIDYFPRFSGRLDDMRDNMEQLMSSEKCDPKVLGSLCEQIASQSSAISSRLPTIMQRIQISARLKLSALNIETHNLSHVTWTEESTSDPSWTLPWDLALTNTEDDLNKDAEAKSLLAMGLLSSRDYEEMTSDIAGMFNSLRGLTVNYLTDILKREAGNVDLFSSVVVVAIGLTIAFLIMFAVFFLIAGRKRRDSMSIIQQKVRIASVEKFTKHYVYALTGLFILLLFFFAFSITSFISISSFPEHFTELGHRAALVPVVNTHIARGCSNPEVMNLAFNDALDSASQLLRAHNDLVPLLIKTGNRQSSLLFDTSFEDAERYFSDSDNNHGMHSLLNYFVDNVKKFANQEANIDCSCDGEYFKGILRAGHLLTNMSFHSIDYFFDYISNQRVFFSTSLLIIFIVFVVLLVVCYVFVFRTMLCTLDNEETTTLSFLDMLSDGALQQSNLLKTYLSAL
ncbi:hypothetical protein GEMRC1_003151 [Eukaryota sp. GEM-RC1]